MAKEVPWNKVNVLDCLIKSGADPNLCITGGLTPLMFETSQQAQVLIPLAVSIAFGILASTVLVLIVIPCTYAILADMNLLKHPNAEG